MESQLVLNVVEQEKSESLRERMDDAGCVFEFVVTAPAAGSSVDEAMHRQVLSTLYEQVMKNLLDWHYGLIQSPEYTDRPKPSLTWDLDKAVATP